MSNICEADVALRLWLENHNLYQPMSTFFIASCPKYFYQLVDLKRIYHGKMLFLVISGSKDPIQKLDTAPQHRDIEILRLYLAMAVNNHWTGLLDWTTGLDYWHPQLPHGHLQLWRPS